VSRHSAERSGSEKLNQANLAMSTARLLVEEREQMLHETGRTLRDQPLLVRAQWWNRPVSDQGAKAESSHSSAHHRTLSVPAQ